jgi:hypothetical protein
MRERVGADVTLGRGGQQCPRHPAALPYQQAATPTPPWLNPGLFVYASGGPTGTAATPGKPTSSVSLPAMPVAGQLSGFGSSRSVETANSRAPSSAAAVTRTSVQALAPEQYCLVPCSFQMPSRRVAFTFGPGGFAAHTPHRLPGSGRGPPSSARIATASAYPSASLASDRSSPARSANAAHRSLVAPEPGCGRFSRPDSTAAANAVVLLLALLLGGAVAFSVPGYPVTTYQSRHLLCCSTSSLIFCPRVPSGLTR